MNPKRRGFSIYKVPNYIFIFATNALKIGAFVAVALIILTITESVGQTFHPKIEVDAYTAAGKINENLYGYSVSSEFQYDANLVNTLNEYPVDSLRLTVPKNAGKRFLAKVDNGVYSILASDNVSYNAFQEYDVEIRVNGSNYTILIDDQQIFSVNDSRFQNGELGLFSSFNQEVYFDDVRVYNSEGGLLFSDSFNSQASGMWNQNGFPSWFDNGSWETINGKYRHVGQQSLAMKKIGNSDWNNYTIQAKITPASGSVYEQGFVGLTFYHQGPLSGYRFMWQGDLPHPYSSNNPWEVLDYEGQIRTAIDAKLKPHAVVNLRGTPEDAANTVRDLNINRGLGVEYFEIGNEIWAFGDSHMPSQTYAAEIQKYAAAMKAVDPKIKVGASLLVGFSNWDIDVIKNAAQHVDFVILHYYPPTKWGQHTSDLQLLAAPYSFGQAFKSSYNPGTKGQINQTKDLLNQYAPGHAERMEILVTEFNTTDSSKGKNLVFGLAAADMIGQTMLNNGQRLQFHALQNSGSHWHPFTSTYQPRPSALALSLFTEHFGSTKLNLDATNVPSYALPELDSQPSLDHIPYLSVYASKNEADNKLYIAAINKHQLASMNTEIKINNAAIQNHANVYTLTAPSFATNNENGNNVKTYESNIQNASSNFNYSFPPRSATIIELNASSITRPINSGTNDNQNISTELFSPRTTDYGTNQSPGEAQIASGALRGGNPHVKTFDKNGTPTGLSFFAFNKDFRGGVDVDLADVNGDGKDDIIVGAGPGGGPHVRIFDHTGREIFNFFPFHPSFRGGVTVAGGDLDGDGKAEVIIAPKSDAQARIKAYKVEPGAPIVSNFVAYGTVESGADVAAGDVDRDGKDEIIVGAGRGGGPFIRVFDENGQVKPIQFFAFHPNYRAGVSVAAADTDGDGKDEIVAAQAGPEHAWVKVYRYNNQMTILGEWNAFGNAKVGGNVGATDLNNDGKDDILVGAGLGGGPQMRGFEASGKPLSTNFFVFDRSFRGGISTAGN